MRTRILVVVLTLSYFVCDMGVIAQSPSGETKIPTGAKVFIAPMNGFETYITAGLKDKSAGRHRR